MAEKLFPGILKELGGRSAIRSKQSVDFGRSDIPLLLVIAKKDLPAASP
jgi:hypothetical protein